MPSDPKDLAIPDELRPLVERIVSHHQKKTWATFRFEMKNGVPEGALKSEQSELISPKPGQKF